MNKIIHILIILLLLSGCNLHTTKTTSIPGDKEKLYTEAKDLRGLGLFEIGKTYNQIKDTLSRYGRGKHLTQLGGFVDDYESGAIPMRYKDTDFVKEYYTALVVCENVMLHQVFLTFWKDSLAKIKVTDASSFLYDIFKIKYGEGEEDRIDLSDSNKDTMSINCYWSNEDISSQYFEITRYKLEDSISVGILEHTSSLEIWDKTKSKKIEDYKNSLKGEDESRK